MILRCFLALVYFVRTIVQRCQCVTIDVKNSASIQASSPSLANVTNAVHLNSYQDQAGYENVASATGATSQKASSMTAFLSDAWYSAPGSIFQDIVTGNDVTQFHVREAASAIELRYEQFKKRTELWNKEKGTLNEIQRAQILLKYGHDPNECKDRLIYYKSNTRDALFGGLHMYPNCLVQRDSSYDQVERNTIFVSYRGTVTYKDWLEFNFNALPTSFDDMIVHKGFLKLASNTFQQLLDHLSDVEKLLKEKYTSYQIILTGHSLGGALATIHAEWLMRAPGYGITPNRLKLITFGAPCLVGYDSYSNNKFPTQNYLRFARKNDLVTTMLLVLYMQRGLRIELEKDADLHGIKTYRQHAEKIAHGLTKKEKVFDVNICAKGVQNALNLVADSFYCAVDGNEIDCHYKSLSSVLRYSVVGGQPQDDTSAAMDIILEQKQTALDVGWRECMKSLIKKQDEYSSDLIVQLIRLPFSSGKSISLPLNLNESQFKMCQLYPTTNNNEVINAALTLLKSKKKVFQKLFLVKNLTNDCKTFSSYFSSKLRVHDQSIENVEEDGNLPMPELQTAVDNNKDKGQIVDERDLNRNSHEVFNAFQSSNVVDSWVNEETNYLISMKKSKLPKNCLANSIPKIERNTIGRNKVNNLRTIPTKNEICESKVLDSKVKTRSKPGACIPDSFFAIFSKNNSIQPL